MNNFDHNPERAAPFEAFLSQPEVKNCVDIIMSARGRLHELGIASCQSRDREFSRVDLEEEFDRLLREVSGGVDDLQGLIRKSSLDMPEGPAGITSGKRDHWSLGIEDFSGSRISILRGELEPVRRVTVASRLPHEVALLFLSIPRLRELLKRENHGWGYHYHYLDANGRRSDTLLTFERQPTTDAGGQQVKILTWERHSEKSHFAARAASWGGKKRESVYDACVDDSAKRSLNDYKIPRKDAENVWPI